LTISDVFPPSLHRLYGATATELSILDGLINIYLRHSRTDAPSNSSIGLCDRKSKQEGTSHDRQ